MSWVYKNKRCLKAFIVIVLIAFSTSGLASNFDSGRIIPGGKVLIYRGDQQVGELTAEAPFPDGALLACDGDCGVRMDGLLLVGADKSLFSVTTQAYSRELLVREGTVYFALSQLPHSLVFVTPKGAVTAQQLILNAAADGGLLKGYVTVTGESAEIGVVEGGSVVVSTVAGETTIESGKRFVLAQTDEGKAPGQDDKAQPETTPSGGVAGNIVPIAVGVGVVAIAALIVVASDSGGGSSGGGGVSTSPAAP